MSLQHAAKYLAHHGRGKDTMLVHMTPREVGSLQTLAKAHGGSLSINPDTGLPEAGFLSAILPAVAGAASTYFTGSPYLGMALAGGLTTAKTGSLTKGLVAGMGAYGGGSLAAGFTPEMVAGEAATAGGAANAVPVVDATPSWVAPPTEAVVGGPIAPSAGPVTTSAIPAPETFSSNPADYVDTAPTRTAMGAMGESAQPFGNAPFEPRPGVTPDNYGQNFSTGPTASSLKSTPTSISDVLSKNATFKNVAMAASPVIMEMGETKAPTTASSGPNPYRYTFDRGVASPFPEASQTGIERSYFPNARYIPYAGGGPVEAMSDANALGANTGFPMADIQRGAYATPYQQPISQNVVTGASDTRVDPYTGEERLAEGGLSDLGGYSDGGRLLRGPGDGVSDSIPAVIGKRQPARLADGEFVVPARIVSELGNGSTEAGARKLYAMLDRVQNARGKTTGKGKVAKNTRADKYLPA